MQYLAASTAAHPSVCGYRFHIEHIVPRASSGTDHIDNLALACAPCNLAKGAHILAVDPATDTTVPLYNPREDRWGEHFTWDADGRTLAGLTPVGRAALSLLDLNALARLDARAFWRELGLLS